VCIEIGGREILAEPGKVHVVPPGVSHRIANRHQDAAAGMFSTLTPALRADELLETLHS
jgi:mannose-6-phosphate isomerase-like protein (cupin superfamily)